MAREEGSGGGERRGRRERRDDREERDNEFVDKLVHITRVAKVVKGGRRIGFAALVVVGHQGAGKVSVRPAPAGTGVIAGGPLRAVFEALGVGDVVCKSMGSSNPYNMVRAIFDGLMNQQSPRMVAQRRGRSVAEIISRREGQKGAQAAAGN